MNSSPFTPLICAAWLVSICVTFAQQITNTNTMVSGFNRYRPGCAPTVAYQEKMEQIMIAEANRFARQMNLPEDLPITSMNVRAIVATPSSYIHDGEVGSLDTGKYSYRVDVGKGVAGVARLHVEDDWGNLKAKYTLPISRLDTNAAFREALQILRAADVDVDSLNRDSGSIRIIASMTEGPNGAHFLPVYWIIWQKWATNVNSLGPEEYENASLTYLEPTKAILALDIFAPKYIHRDALECPDLFPLLATDPKDNPPDAVLREIESGTNAAIWRQILLEQHVSEAWLNKSGLGPTNTLPQTNAPVVSH